MHAHPPAPSVRTPLRPRVLILEARPGTARRARLEALAQQAHEGAPEGRWLLSADAGREGAMAGLDGWMRSLLSRLEAEAPDLLVRYDAELTAVLPELRLRMQPRYVTLTDSSGPGERVRNYARDRAHRFPQGLVDLLDEWHTRTDAGPWTVACDHFDHRGGLTGHFFRALVRRRGEKLGLRLLLAVDPGAGDAAAEELGPFADVERMRLDLAPDVEERMEPAEAARRAEALEWVRGNEGWSQMFGHEVIRYWNLAGRTDRATDWHARMLGIYAHLGYYQDGLRHLPFVRDSLHLFDGPSGAFSRAEVLNHMQVVYITCGMPHEALRVLEEEGLRQVTVPAQRADILYLIAMLHARHLPERDQALAERFLQEALKELGRARIPEAQRQFGMGFVLNGLAYVRFRQGDTSEAASLSHQNIDRLEQHLDPTRQRLHRSVLLYNAGQVYGRIGDHAKAAEYITRAMEMDPHYSEYFNDRGNICLKMGRLEDAERDFLHAIELSPPYPEVWFNLGQCYARMRRPAEAEAAFARTVDLDPGRIPAWVNLALARQALGRGEDALAAYDAAIAQDASNALVLSNRAALRAGLNRLDDALADLDRAVSLDPENPALHRNRARILHALGRAEEAAPAFATA
jgi:tetratricopeptide (TPR) repeat protein